MKKLFEYRECRNSCRGPEACSPRVNSYLMEPSNSFYRVNPTLHCIRWKEYHRLHPQSITSSFDTTPKGKNPRGPLGRQPRATKLESGLSLQITAISRQPCKVSSLAGGREFLRTPASFTNGPGIQCYLQCRGGGGRAWGEGRVRLAARDRQKRVLLLTSAAYSLGT